MVKPMQKIQKLVLMFLFGKYYKKQEEKFRTDFFKSSLTQMFKIYFNIIKTVAVFCLDTII